MIAIENTRELLLKSVEDVLLDILGLPPGDYDIQVKKIGNTSAFSEKNSRQFHVEVHNGKSSHHI